nr:cationic amino acid transporter 1-like isoform X1 [Ipomoea trifida]GMC64196.1 cationic amino acid transporter 1-like [Ipomoea batatas]GMC65540.1 cationic amino acid transporter 1-like [Ipomoea batatas]GME04027.1 cationic amino acid transporter 1-like [Ipomoea batatas]GME20172.1 cationic amino acid transporter 1-like [Ipomoea batatas]
MVILSRLNYNTISVIHYGVWFLSSSSLAPLNVTPIKNYTPFAIVPANGCVFFKAAAADLLSISSLSIFLLVVFACSSVSTMSWGSPPWGTATNLSFFLHILGPSIATAASNAWIAYFITLPILLLSTVGLRYFVPHAPWQLL